MWFALCKSSVPEAPEFFIKLDPLLFLNVTISHSIDKKTPAEQGFSAAVTMFPRVILKDTLIKKSQQKKRTSPCNYKERVFVLDTQELSYSENRPGVSASYLSFRFSLCQSGHLSFTLSGSMTALIALEIHAYAFSFRKSPRWRAPSISAKSSVWKSCAVMSPFPVTISIHSKWVWKSLKLENV